MNDLATLGIAVDTSPAVKAATDLERMAVAAERAEDAVTGLGDKSATALREVGKGASTLPAALKEVEDGATGAGRAASGMVSPALINQMKSFEASLRSGASSTAELEVQRSRLRSLQKAGIADDAYAIQVNKQLDKTQQELAKSAVQQEKAIDQLMRSIDPAAGKLAKLERETEALGKLFDAGSIDAAKYAKSIGLLDEKMKKLEAANDPIAKFSLSSKSARQDVMQLGNAIAAGDWQGAARNLVQIGSAAGTSVAAMAAAAAPALLLTGVIAGLGVMYYDTIKQAREFNAAINGGTNSAGQTIQSMGEMADRVGQISGNFGGAREAVIALASSTNASAVQMENLAEAGAAIGEITGKSAADVATSFAGMGDNATDAAEKISAKYGLITAAQYDIIKALDDNGEHQKALDVLSEDLNEAAQARLKKYRDSLSDIERDWLDIKKAISEAYSAVKSEVFPGESKKIVLLQRQIDYINNHPVASGITSIFTNGLKSRDEVLAGLKAEQEALQRGIDLKAKSANEDAETVIANQQVIKTTKQLNDQLDASSPLAKRDKLTKELNDRYNILFDNTKKLTKADQDLLKGVTRVDGKISGGAYDTILKGINDKNKDPKVAAGAVDLTAFNDAKNRIVAITAEYANMEKELDASHKAGIYSDQSYYEQKSAILQQQQVEVNAAYQSEISALEAAKSKKGTTAAQSIQLDQKIADARTQMVKSQQDADSKLSVLATNEKGRLDSQTAAIKPYVDALNDEIAKVKEQQATIIAGAGMGDEARRRLQEDIKIQQQYQEKLNKLARDYNNSNKSEDKKRVYDAETDAVRAALAQRLDAQRDYYAETDRQQQNWVDGASAAYNTYLEQAQNVAGMTKTAFTSAFTSLEDTLVGFITRSGASFKSFANAIIADFARIALKASVMPTILGAFGFSRAASADVGGGGAGGTGGFGAGDLFSAGKNLFDFSNSGFGQSIMSGWNSGEGIYGGLKGAFSSGSSYASNGISGMFSSGSGSTAAGYANVSNFGAGIGGSTNGFMGSGLSGLGAAGYGVGGALYGYQQAGVKGAVTGGLGATAGAMLGNILLPGIGAIIGGALGGMIGGSLFGGEWQTKDQGLQLGVTDGDFVGNQFEYQKKKGGLFSSNKKRTRLSALDPEMQKSLDDTYDATEGAVTDLFDRLSIKLNDGVLDGLGVASTQISTKDKTAEQIQEEITKWFGGVADSMTSAIDAATGAGLAGYNFEGLTTFVNNLYSVNTAFTNLNLKLYDTSVAGGKMSEQLLSMAGGMEAFGAATSAYYDNYYTDLEKANNVVAAVSKQFADLDIDLPDTREAFRAVVDGLDLTTEAGRQMFVTLTQLSASAAASYSILEQRQGDYFGAFYTETENTDRALKATTDKFKELGVALPETRAGFRAMVEALDLTTETGKAMYATLMSVAGAAGQVYDTLEQRTAAALSGAVTSSMSAVQRAITAQQKAATAAYNATNAALNDMASTASASVQALTGIGNTLSSALKKLQSDSDDAAKMLRSQAQATLQSALATARAGGSLAGFDGLSDALDVVGSNTTDLYSSLEAFNRDQGRTANVVDELNKLNGKQLTTAEQSLKGLQTQIDLAKAAYDAQMAGYDAQLEFAQAQIDALGGIDNSVLSVTDAVNAMNLAVMAALAGIGGPATAGTVANNGALIDTTYKALLGRDADAAGRDYWLAQLSSGAIAYDQLAQAIANAARENGSAINVPGFATGGDHLGGWRIVGENGPELEATGRSRIFNANQTAQMLKGGGGDSDIGRKVDVLIDVVKQIVGPMKLNSDEGNRLFRKWDTVGIPTTTVAGSVTA